MKGLRFDIFTMFLVTRSDNLRVLRINNDIDNQSISCIMVLL